MSDDTRSLPRGIIGYEPALDDEIFAFQQAAYPERRTDWLAPRWQWMFLRSAERLGVAPMVWMFRNADGIVAHQGAIPVKLRIAEQEFVTGWFVETMALESVRGKAVGPMLVQKALNDLPFNLSLGQTEQMRQLQFALGWKQVTPLETYALVINPYQVLKSRLSNPLVRGPGAFALGAVQAWRRLRGRFGRDGETRAVTIQRFGTEHDELWQAVRSDHACAVVRDASYLNWKYVQQPGQDFIRLEIQRGGQPVAVVVLTVREPDEHYRYRRGFIVDLVAPPADRKLLWAVLEHARKALKKRGADLVVFHFIGGKVKEAVSNFGFVRREPTRFLLVSTNGAAPEVERRALDPEAWYVTMGDSDIDRPWT